ncbi:MAG: hypothetical protein GJ676_05300 [Rhodobacteraceae bacterium]|nr:hypothetical protein [Paracoccaceae bacterium]
MACSACGAPLSAQKSLKYSAKEKTGKKDKSSRPGAHMAPNYTATYKPKKKKKKKSKRKGLFAHVLEEAFDVIEDIFD